MKKWIYLVPALFLLVSCGGSSHTRKPETCSIQEQNRFVYDYMQNNYLWYKELPQIDYKEYSSPEILLTKLKNKKDKWSFIIDKKTLDAYFDGKGYIGYGFKLMFDANEDLYITLVYPNSPASEANLTRGSKIVKINGVAVEDIKDFNTVFGEDKVGVETTLDLEVNGVNKKVTLKKEKVEAPSVLKADILNIDGLKVGYLLFDKFIEPSTDELKDAFEKFKKQDIDKLIIDLRYNGGGLVNVANDLVSLILLQEKKKSFTLEFNDKNSYKNNTYYLKKYKSSLDLDEVYFITTHSTCSASEAVINALAPYGVDAKVVGSKTCGKPVGMSGGEFCNKYIMPIEFKIINADGNGDYFGGLSIDCGAKDDIYHDFADTNESMLKETLYLMQNGVCSKSSKRARLINSEQKSMELKGLKEITGGAF
jgi:C-terminal processing protease CtpA/Prc